MSARSANTSNRKKTSQKLNSTSTKQKSRPRNCQPDPQVPFFTLGPSRHISVSSTRDSSFDVFTLGPSIQSTSLNSVSAKQSTSSRKPKKSREFKTLSDKLLEYKHQSQAAAGNSKRSNNQTSFMQVLTHAHTIWVAKSSEISDFNCGWSTWYPNGILKFMLLICNLEKILAPSSFSPLSQS